MQKPKLFQTYIDNNEITHLTKIIADYIINWKKSMKISWSSCFISVDLLHLQDQQKKALYLQNNMPLIKQGLVLTLIFWFWVRFIAMLPTVAFNICCPRDCDSRHNGGTRGAPLKPLRVDSAKPVRHGQNSTNNWI